jgi:ubiquinone/menaquinone biosynthesis C-methylase UbiE
LRDVDIKPGFRVLDYGCGPGSFSIAAAELVGESGKVYAVDIHPLAIKSVQQKALKKGLTNIETLQSDCKTGLENNSIDIVLLLDIFHSLKYPNDILAELQRILKPNALLSFNDHHMSEDKILLKVTEQGFFKFLEKRKNIFLFIKV